jgi:hypothetical protein
MFSWFKAKPKPCLGEQEAKKIMDAAVEIVMRYGKVYEGLGTAIADTSRLPAPKAEMKTALKLAWHFAEGNQRMQSWVETGYVLLANFQDGVGPEPIDCGLSPDSELAKAAATLEPWLKWSPQVQAEMSELLAEFDSFKRGWRARQ